MTGGWPINSGRGVKVFQTAITLGLWIVGSKGSPRSLATCTGRRTECEKCRRPEAEPTAQTSQDRTKHDAIVQSKFVDVE
jgi:hypothetical protein